MNQHIRNWRRTGDDHTGERLFAPSTVQLRCVFAAFIFFCMEASIYSEDARAQLKGSVTGLDISLEKLEVGCYDRPYRARGVVYEVVGIAGLRPAADATVLASLAGTQKRFTTDARGVFEINLKAPLKAAMDREGASEAELELEVKKGRHSREYAFEVSLKSPLSAVLKTDRNRYEPGETVHFWSRVDDSVTGRPLSGIPVVIAASFGEKREIVTSSSGVAAADFALKKNEKYGSGSISLSAEGQVVQSVNFEIRKHGNVDLSADLKVTPAIVEPGGSVDIEVKVRSIQGTPMRDADVSVDISTQTFEGKTDLNGKVIFHAKAPLVADNGSRFVTVRGEATHAGCLASSFRGSVEVRFKAAYNIAVLVPGRGLVPGVDDQLLVSVETRDGGPPEAGIAVELRGSAFKGGARTATVDRHGFASVPIRLTRGDYAAYAAGECSSENSTGSDAATTIEARIKGGSPEETTRLCVPVLENVFVLPFVPKPAVELGASFEVFVERRPEANDLPVSVELFCGESAGPVDAAIAAPKVKSVRLFAPKNRLGVCSALARPMLDTDNAPSFGLGVSTPVLVRPSLPSFPSLSFDKEQYSIREQAHLTIRAPKGAPKSWIAAAVRDLARHDGEVPFDEYFMDNELQKAVLDPSTKEADLLIRAAIIGYAASDEDEAANDESSASEFDGTDRSFEAHGPLLEVDAARLAASLRRESVGQWMVAVEQLLEQSLASETIEEITVGKGASRRFRKDAVTLAMEASGQGEALTLGEGSVTTEMLSDLDPSFTFENAAKRVARKRLVHLMSVLSTELNPEENDETRSIGRTSIPPERQLSEMVRRGTLSPADLRDPWGMSFVIRKTKKPPRFVLSQRFEGFALLSPGPDGVVDTDDDIVDPWMRAIPEGTFYARASGEDGLMARLSAISPRSAMFDKLLSAYNRVNDEAVEELKGDAMGNMFGDQIGDAFGSGGLGLTGTGAGGGGIGEGTIGLGTLGTIGHGAGSAGSALQSVLREEFPPTLYFKAEAPLSPSGVTELVIPLADAATTYIVEAFVWREDGWRWSASTQISVNQDMVIDAPLPQRATVGDEIVLPVSLSNRRDTARTVRVEIRGTDELRIAPIEIDNVVIPPRDTVEVSTKATFSKAASGKMTFAAVDENGNLIDAVRRPIVIKPTRRKAKTEINDILRGDGKIRFDIPQGAEPSGTNALSLSLGESVFRRDENRAPWTGWLDAMLGRAANPSGNEDPWKDYDISTYSADKLAAMLGTGWAESNIRNSSFERVLEVLSDHAEKEKASDIDSVRRLSQVLWFLAPLVVHADARKGLEKPVSKLLTTLRIKVENGAALFADAPWLFARCAAALYWTASKKKAGRRAAELLKRAKAAVVSIGDDLWFEGGRDDALGENGKGDDLFGATAALAVAEIRNGDDDEAFQLVRSLARLIHFDASGKEIFERIGVEDEIAAALAAALLGDGGPKPSIKVVVDGERREVDLTGSSFPLEGDVTFALEGRGRIKIPALGTGGLHTVEIEDEGRSVVLMQADVEYTVDWNAPPPHVGPFVVRIDGEVGVMDKRSELKLVIRNRIPRTVQEPVVEIFLPASAQMDEEADLNLKSSSVGEPTVADDTLTLRLPPMRPEEEVSIPLPWMWTSAGKFSGLGVSAWAAERPEAISVLPSRVVEVRWRMTSGGGAR